MQCNDLPLVNKAANRGAIRAVHGRTVRVICTPAQTSKPSVYAYPHPLRQRRQAAAQVVLNALSMIGVFEDRDKEFAEASVVGRKHGTQPMKRLHETHSGAARPIKAAGCGLEVERQVAEGDGPQAAIGEHADARRNGIGESEVTGGGEAIDHPDFALAGQRVDHVAPVWIGRLSCMAVILGDVVEAARNPSQAFGGN